MHKYLLPGYIDALFRVVLRPEQWISGLAMGMAARFCGDRRLIRVIPSRAGSLPHWMVFLMWERACSRKGQPCHP
ncbi:hypothetical protein EMIT0P260_110020 [Pseudomonas sp. IT-P260]